VVDHIFAITTCLTSFVIAAILSATTVGYE
jgi:hypothetical protein